MSVGCVVELFVDVVSSFLQVRFYQLVSEPCHVGSGLDKDGCRNG